MTSKFHVGQRLSYGKDLCTVRYIGSVEGTNGEWLGVEWDTVQRGKHSGEYAGRKYFECKIPNSATFVRPTRAPDEPVSFLQALRAKYTPERSAGSHAMISLSTTKVFEEVGFDKIQEKLARLRELRVVLVDGMSIARGDGVGEVLECCPAIEELDVSRNLWEVLEDIAGVCEGLKGLKSLRISGNRLSSLDVRSESAFKNVQSLEINNTLLDWEEVVHILGFFPNITTLLSSQNNTSSIPASISLPPTLKIVNLEQNAFTSLSAIFPLSLLPHLQKLILSHNNISAIDPSNNTTTFQSLQHLDLSFNSLEAFPLLDLIPPIFPSLNSLRISHNPLFSSLPLEEAHMLAVARMPARVTTLNFSAITPAERANAEMYYLSRVAKGLAGVGEDAEASVLKDHARWEELCDCNPPPKKSITRGNGTDTREDIVYGKPVIDRHKETDRTLRPKLIGSPPPSSAHRITNFSPEIEFIPPSAPAITKYIPKSLPISTLKGLVGRMFAIPPLDVKLEFLLPPSPPDGATTFPADDDVKSVGFYADTARARVQVSMVEK